jgi:hypothetical protein
MRRTSIPSRRRKPQDEADCLRPKPEPIEAPTGVLAVREGLDQVAHNYVALIEGQTPG